jgi:hypothetical protein
MATPSMTLEDAIAEVLGRIGQEDDGVANPLLVAEARRHINAAQRQLMIEYEMQTARRRVLVPVAAGQRFLAVPDDATNDLIDSVQWHDESGQVPLAADLDPLLRGQSGPAAGYGMRPTTGVVALTITSGGTGYTSGLATITGGTQRAGGHAPVVELTATGGVLTAATVIDPGSEWTAAPTLAGIAGTGAVLTVSLGPVNAIELAPVPDASGQLEIGYDAAVVTLDDDEDLLALDPEAVIGRASVLLAIAKQLGAEKSLTSVHALYMRAFEKKQTPGSTLSLSGWRRDGRAGW